MSERKQWDGKELVCTLIHRAPSLSEHVTQSFLLKQQLKSSSSSPSKRPDLSSRSPGQPSPQTLHLTVSAWISLKGPTGDVAQHVDSKLAANLLHSSRVPVPTSGEHVSSVQGVPPVQYHPYSTRHMLSQPSPSMVLPSSHCSEPVR